MNDHLNQVGFCEPMHSPRTPLSSISNMNARFEYQLALGSSLEAESLKKHDSILPRNDDFLIEVAPEVLNRFGSHDPYLYHS